MTGDDATNANAAQPGGVQVRDRIKELRRVKARELLPASGNPRLHPKSQQTAVRALLQEIGYADVLIARETTDGRLELIDGHLRRELTPDAEVPVLVTDLTEAEADLMLATHDETAALAKTDAGKLKELLDRLPNTPRELDGLLTDLRERATKALQVRSEPEITLSPELLERQDYLVFTFDNELDWRAITDEFAVGKVYAYDPKTVRPGIAAGNVGTGHVIDGKKLLAKLRTVAT